MVRFAIIGVVVGVALILYALVDAAMSDPARARGVSKPVWVVIIVVLPVIGAVLWFVIGKGRGPMPVAKKAPDDDPLFTGARFTPAEIDAHVEELEARLRELDNEVFPEADPRDSAPSGTARSVDSKGTDTQGTEPKASEPKASDPKNGTAKPGSDAAGEQR